MCIQFGKIYEVRQPVVAKVQYSNYTDIYVVKQPVVAYVSYTALHCMFPSQVVCFAFIS